MARTKNASFPADGKLCRFIAGTILVLGCLAAGCAAPSRMERLMPQVTTLISARHYFGEPTAVTPMGDGTTRYEWVLNRNYTQPGREVVQQIYMGHDRDGYRRYRERKVFVPSYTERQYCRMLAFVDESGKMLDVTWEGDSCDYLPVVPLVPDR